MYLLSVPMEDELHIPAKSAMELSKFPVTEYCFSNKWVCFKTDDDVIFSCSVIDGDFPYEKLQNFFKEMTDLPIIELPSELKQTIDETLMLASNDSITSGKVINLHFEKNELTVSASNDLGEVTKTLGIDFEEEPIDVTINASLISQIINKATEFSIGENKVFFANPEFQHLMVKIKDK
jgi:DNA polymerase III sliding clamp (beta) subunit (PCNA family)